MPKSLIRPSHVNVTLIRLLHDIMSDREDSLLVFMHLEKKWSESPSLIPDHEYRRSVKIGSRFQSWLFHGVSDLSTRLTYALTFSSTSSNDNISPSAEIRGSPRNPIFTPSESSLRESIISVLGGALGSLKQLKTAHTKSFVRSTPGMCQRGLLFLKLEPCVSSSTEVHAVVSQFYFPPILLVFWQT